MSDFTSSVKKNKSLGIIVSILIALCGILIFTTPIGSGVLFIWAIMAAMFVNGISKVISYFLLPKETRNGWLLAIGIISIILSLLFIEGVVAKPLGLTLGIFGMIGYFMGFYEIVNGISQLFSAGAVKNAGGSGGWLIFIGIVNIICGIFVASHPIFSYFALEVMTGFYLCVIGVCSFIECLCMKSDK